MTLTADGFHVARSQVTLNAPIKTLGLHTVPVVLHPEVSVTVTVNVARSAEEAERQVRGENVTAREEFDLDDLGLEAAPRWPRLARTIAETRLQACHNQRRRERSRRLFHGFDSMGPTGSHVPRIDDRQPRVFEMPHIARCQSAAIDQRDSSDHPVGARHLNAVPRCLSHDLAIDQRRFLGEWEDATGETPAQRLQPTFQPFRALVRPDLLDAECHFGDHDGR